MRVLVLGAGVIGVATAWYLARAGHRVRVIERRDAAGLETSFANGGQISASHPEPWANPGAPGQILRWLGREDAPLKFRPRADWNQWSWGLRFLAECLPGRSRSNADAIAALALDSRRRLRALREETGIEYDCLAGGILHLFFDRRDHARAADRAARLRAYGMQARVLDPAACLELEPALDGCRDRIIGGLYAPEDESGDAHRFTQALARLAACAGAEFEYGTRVTGWYRAGEAVLGVRIVDAGERTGLRDADAVVVCLGSRSAVLAAELGERLPIYPVKGYSVTLPLAADARAPRVSITDESRRIVCSRLGERLRVAGTAELTGFDESIQPARCESILRRAGELFPGVPATGPVEFWAGLRPATPSNVPIIGRSSVAKVYYNTGHGTLGWTLACGSGAAITEIVSGGRPALAFPFLAQ